MKQNTSRGFHFDPLMIRPSFEPCCNHTGRSLEPTGTPTNAPGTSNPSPPDGLVRATPTLEFSYAAWITQNRDTIAEMKRLEEDNNRLFIDAYGLADELTSDVPIEQITLTVNPAYRYGGKLTVEEQWSASARTPWRR